MRFGGNCGARPADRRLNQPRVGESGAKLIIGPSHANPAAVSQNALASAHLFSPARDVARLGARVRVILQLARAMESGSDHRRCGVSGGSVISNAAVVTNFADLSCSTLRDIAGVVGPWLCRDILRHELRYGGRPNLALGSEPSGRSLGR